MLVKTVLVHYVYLMASDKKKGFHSVLAVSLRNPLRNYSVNLLISVFVIHGVVWYNHRMVVPDYPMFSDRRSSF